jgi:hypothetical protein
MIPSWTPLFTGLSLKLVQELGSHDGCAFFIHRGSFVATCLPRPVYHFVGKMPLELQK